MAAVITFTICNLCNSRVRFGSIQDSFGKILKESGFPYKLSEFETLNYRRYKCPECGSNDRDRLYKLYLDTHPLLRGSKVVDFAPSPQLQKYLKSLTIEYRSADLYMKGVDDKVDITNMKKYRNESFDFFICSHLLEHVDDKKALKELWRIVKKGGKGILMTPIIDRDDVFDEDMKVTDTSERWKRFAQDDHIRLYSKKIFISRVMEAGFTINQIAAKALAGTNVLMKHGISRKSVLYVVEKK